MTIPTVNDDSHINDDDSYDILNMLNVVSDDDDVRMNTDEDGEVIWIKLNLLRPWALLLIDRRWRKRKKCISSYERDVQSL